MMMMMDIYVALIYVRLNSVHLTSIELFNFYNDSLGIDTIILQSEAHTKFI